MAVPSPAGWVVGMVRRALGCLVGRARYARMSHKTPSLPPTGCRALGIPPRHSSPPPAVPPSPWLRLLAPKCTTQQHTTVQRFGRPRLALGRLLARPAVAVAPAFPSAPLYICSCAPFLCALRAQAVLRGRRSRFPARSLLRAGVPPVPRARSPLPAVAPWRASLRYGRVVLLGRVARPAVGLAPFLVRAPRPSPVFFRLRSLRSLSRAAVALAWVSPRGSLSLASSVRSPSFGSRSGFPPCASAPSGGLAHSRPPLLARPRVASPAWCGLRSQAGSGSSWVSGVRA